MVDKFYFHFTMDECKWLGLNVSKTKLLLFGILFGLKSVWPFVHTQTHTDTLYIYIHFFLYFTSLSLYSFTAFTKPWASILLSEDQHIWQISMVLFFICIAYLQCMIFFLSTALNYQASDWCTCCPAYWSGTEYLICLHNSIFHRLSHFQTHQMISFQRLDIYFFSASGLSVHELLYFV